MTSTPQISVDPNAKDNANLVYILYLVGIVVGIAILVGVIMAYISKGKGDAILDSHYNNQINIFWKAILYPVIGIVLMNTLNLLIGIGIGIVLLGVFILPATLIWYIVRCVKGMQALSAGQPIENPGRWLF
jgi:uncharacterized membrane protein